MTARPSMWLFVAVAALIAALAFAAGQIQDGAGVLLAVLLASFWTITAHKRWGKING